jgi:hypothetical protein
MNFRQHVRFDGCFFRLGDGRQLLVMVDGSGLHELSIEAVSPGGNMAGQMLLKLLIMICQNHSFLENIRLGMMQFDVTAGVFSGTGDVCLGTLHLIDRYGRIERVRYNGVIHNVVKNGVVGRHFFFFLFSFFEKNWNLKKEEALFETTRTLSKPFQQNLLDATICHEIGRVVWD